jgi:hypothetical protein
MGVRDNWMSPPEVPMKDCKTFKEGQVTSQELGMKGVEFDI